MMIVFSHGNVSLFPFKPFFCQVATVDFTAWYVQKDMPKSLLLLLLSLKVTVREKVTKHIQTFQVAKMEVLTYISC